MRRFAAALASVAVLVAACGHSDKSSAPSLSTTPRPVAVSALDTLLLSPDQVSADMGATGMVVISSPNTMRDDSAGFSDKNCLATYPAENLAYVGSRWIAVRVQELRHPGETWRHGAAQAVVLFPAASDAAAFFTASVLQWQSCANRQFTDSAPPPVTLTVGAVSNNGGMLSVPSTREGPNSLHCQRALTVRNNVAVDVRACGPTQGDYGLTIANQIADKVTKP